MKKFEKLKSLFTLLSVSASLFPIANNSIINAKTSYRYIRGATNAEVDEIANEIIKNLKEIETKKSLFCDDEDQKTYSASILEDLYMNGTMGDTIPNLTKSYIDAGKSGNGVDSCTFRSAMAVDLFAKKDIVSFSLSVNGHSATVYLNENGEPWVLNIYNDSKQGKFQCDKTKLRDFLEKQALSDPVPVFPVVSSVGYNANEMMLNGASPAMCLQLLYKQINSEFPGKVTSDESLQANYKFKNGLLSSLKDLERSWCPYCWPVFTLDENPCKFNGENVKRLVLLPSIADMSAKWDSAKLDTAGKSKISDQYVLTSLPFVAASNKDQKYGYLSIPQAKYGKPFILAFYKLENFDKTLYNLKNLKNSIDAKNSQDTVMSKFVYDTLKDKTSFDKSELKLFFMGRSSLVEKLIPNISNDNLKKTDLKYFLAHPFGYRVGEENYVLSKKERQNLKFKENQLKSTYLKSNVDKNGVPYYIPPTNSEKK